jgi:CDP-paratose 2-epimerase
MMPRNGSDDSSSRYALITGGAGFIGTNVAARLATLGHNVLVFDNLSRPGVERNIQWLRQQYGRRIFTEFADVSDRLALRRAVRGASQVYHFAAQVAVTTSYSDPRLDFETNVAGTHNLLEELRRIESPPSLIYTSTNKVYGHLGDYPLRETPTRYEPAEGPETGIDERRPLDFRTPYGCSKGAADQYVLDYSRSFGIPAVVFRMSCIYGSHQCGNEDQGWVAHFLIRALEGEPITLYGDGKQVRDILYAEDLVDAFLAAQRKMPALAGNAYNIGGGPQNAVSLLELVERIGLIAGDRPAIRFESWRPGDQRYYVSNTRRFQAATGWSPRVIAAEGVRRLYEWLRLNRQPETVALAAREAS